MDKKNIISFAAVLSALVAAFFLAYSLMKPEPDDSGNSITRYQKTNYESPNGVSTAMLDLDGLGTVAEYEAPDEEKVSKTASAIADKIAALDPLEIDYEALLETNEDFVGVITIPSLQLQYPLVISQDDKEYLSMAFDRTASSAGSLYLEKSMAADMTLPNTFIFGHNMKNGTMFGSLKKFEKDSSLCVSDPAIFIYRKVGDTIKVYQYKIFAYYTASVNSALYRTITDSEYEVYVKEILDESNCNTYKGDIDFSNHPKLLTLSTCYGVGHVNNFVVQAALVDITEKRAD